MKHLVNSESVMWVGAVVLALVLCLAAPVVAEAQPAATVYRIGLVTTFPVDPQSPPNLAFDRGLRDHGYVEGQNLQIERRYSEGKPERLPALVGELLSLRVSLIVTVGPVPSRAVKAAVTNVPIVFVMVADPIGMGLVASLARPGGNVTGFATLEWETFTAKQLEILKEALPGISRVAILLNPKNPMHSRTLPQEQAAADRLRVKLHLVEARQAGDLDQAFVAAMRERVDVLHVWGDPLTYSQRTRIVELAMMHRLPTLHFYAEAVEAGGLLSFGPDPPHIWRGVGSYVDKILKGTRPADLPVVQPTKYELTINLKTAKTLGLTISPSVLLRADRIIE